MQKHQQDGIYQVNSYTVLKYLLYVQDCPGQVIEAESREKTIVSRSYPTSFGNNWYCKYNIHSPGN